MDDEFKKIQESIDEINIEIKNINILLKKPFVEWTENEIEQFSSKDYLREEKNKLRDKEKILMEKENKLREKENKLIDEKILLLNRQNFNGNNYLHLFSLTFEDPDLTGSLSNTMKESYIDKLQEHVTGHKFSDYERKILKDKPIFSHRLIECFHDKKLAKKLVSEVQYVLKTTVKKTIRKTNGYVFESVISNAGQSNVMIFNAYNDTETKFCAKISNVDVIKKEYEVSKIVKGPCIMPILDFLEFEEPGREEKRAAIMSPLYSMTLDRYSLESDLVPDWEDQLIAIILCGLSAVTSFALQSICHYDIKLNNIMMSHLYKFVLIDFGSATKYDTVSDSTPGYSFKYLNPSIRYDLSSLIITIVKFIMAKPSMTFESKEELFKELNNYKSKYPIVYEILEILKPIIDTDITKNDLISICNKIYQFSCSKASWITKYDHLKI